MIDPSGRKAERNAGRGRRKSSDEILILQLDDAVIAPFRITASASSNDPLYLSLGTVRTGDLWTERKRTLVVVLTRQGRLAGRGRAAVQRRRGSKFEI
jgi:hypothetical protein